MKKFLVSVVILFGFYAVISISQSSHVDGESFQIKEKKDVLLTGWDRLERERDMLKYEELQEYKEEKAIKEREERLEKERLAEEKRLEEERLAEEKRREEEALERARVRAQEEEAKRAQEEAAKQAKEETAKQNQEKQAEQKTSSSNGVQSSQETSNSTSSGDNSSSRENSQSTSTSDSQSAPKPAKRTDGFNFNGHHFPLSTFTGAGQVPLHTPYVFQWSNRPSHYLIERVSPAGNVITGVNIGTKITVNGNEYTVTNVERNVKNTDTASLILDKHPSTITFQTCQTNRDSNNRAYLTIWYAQ